MHSTKKIMHSTNLLTQRFFGNVYLLLFKIRNFGNMKQKTIYVISVLIFTLMIFSCKKDTKTTTTSNSNTNSVATLYNGFLWTTRTTTKYPMPNIYSFTKGHTASFTSSPSPKADNSIYALVDSVYLNNVKMNLDGNNANLSYGFGMNDTCNCFPEVWKIYGNNVIPSFTYTDSLPFPNYTDTSIPDTINRAQDLIIPTSGLSNYDTFSFSVCGNITFTKSFNSSTTIPVKFTSDSLLLLSPSNSNGTFIKIWVTKST